jgi:peroxiredoxin
MGRICERATSRGLVALVLLAASSIGCRGAERVEPPKPAQESAPPPPAEAPAPSSAEAPPKPRDRKGTGASQGTEHAVLDGLRWLARHQNDDGSWGAASMRSHCPDSTPCYDARLTPKDWFDVGLTSLALLCFLDAGFSQESKQDVVDTVNGERHRIGEIVKKGLDWLRDRQKADGSFTADRPFMYNEAIATMALAKSFELTRNRDWNEPAQKAIEFIEAAQRLNPSGEGLCGWRYESRNEIEARPGFQGPVADTSVTAWCVLALEAGRLAGLEVKPESMQGAMEFCRYVTADNGLVGYIDKKSAGATVSGPFDSQFKYHPTTMSALGMGIRIFATHDPNDPVLPLAAKRIVQDLPAVSEDHASIDYYYWHFASLALHQLDGPESPSKSGKYWNPWARAMVDSVLSLQDHTANACSNGGWILSDRWGNYSGAGPLYNTAMNVLTLETFYAYQNSFAIAAYVGAAAPELKLIDDQDSVFTLSDHRGSVVLLDFWTPDAARGEDYVGPRRELVTRLQGKPFVLLSLPLDSDDHWEDTEPPPGPQVRGTPMWRCSRLIGMDDPIRSKFTVSKRVSVVVDATGIVRAASGNWSRTTAFVERLLDELEKEPKPK